MEYQNEKQVTISLHACKDIKTRGVHGSVRFGLDLKNQPNYINFVKYKPNWTENRFKPNRPDSVKSGFLGKKPENLNPNPDPPTQNSTWSFALSSKS